MMVRKVYSKLPKSIQNATRYAYCMIPLSIRYGKVFRETYAFLQESQWWSREQLEEYQFSKLKELLTFCSMYVPFYQKRWAKYGINIDNIKDSKDVAKIPFTTKQDIIESSSLMVPTIYNKNNLLLSHTGGTTGSKAFFYVTREAVQKENAFFARYWNWHGYNFMKDNCVIFRGSKERPSKIIEKFGKYHIFSSFDLTPERLKEYIKYIAKNKIKYMQAYPSFAFLLFQFAYENDLMNELAHMKCIFCASEKMHDYQRDFIEKNIDIKVFQHYGHMELVSLFQQCEYNNAYHNIPEYGYTEFDSVSDGLFEIISTGFNNSATPLIRYRTKDYVKLQRDIACPCGLKYLKTVKEIEGRSGDMLITPGGRLIGPTHLEFVLKGEMTAFMDLQFIQEELNHLTILIVPSPTYKEGDKELLGERVLWRLGEKMDIDIQIVDEIKKPINQKKRLTVSKLKM